MNLIKVMKILTSALVTIIFFSKAVMAVYNLINPYIIDSTKTHSIQDIVPPLITICPHNQLNLAKLAKLGYSSYKSFLLGYHNTGLTSWGGGNNFTFEQIVGEVRKLNEHYPQVLITTENDNNTNIDVEKRFYPKFGWCIDITNYNITEEVKLEVYVDKNKDSAKAEVFLTDVTLRTMNTIHTQSHWGPSIVIDHHNTYNYLVKVEELSNYDPMNPDDCREYNDDDFEKCVEEGLQDVWKPGKL
jgi:hypothetical protein